MRSLLLVALVFFAAPFAHADTPMSPGEREIEAYFAPTVTACDKGDGAACRRLAQRLHFATNEREQKRIVAAGSRRCAAGDAAACTIEALALAHGITVAPDVKRAVELLRRSCAQNEPMACGELAELLAGAPGTSGERDEGVRLARQSCDRLGGWPCMTAALQLRDPHDGARRVALEQRACDGGDAMACYELGMRLAEGDDSTRRDDGRATKLYAKACDADFAQACFNLAWQHLSGTGAAQDERRGLLLVERACRLGDASACDLWAERSGKIEEACDRWGARACFSLAEKLSAEHGETAPVAQGILSAVRRGCARGDVHSCNVLGHLAEDMIHECDAGSEVNDSCTFAGLVYASGIELPRLDGNSIAADPSRARQCLDRACAQHEATACAALKRLPAP